MTKGSRAMAVAMIYPEPKRGVHSRLKNSTGDFDKGYLSHARTVLHWAPELADAVLAGAEPLDRAYAEVKRRRCRPFGWGPGHGPIGRDNRSMPDIRALVVDDNVDVATTTALVLQEYGCKTAVAYSGDVALKVARRFQPNLVFIDLRMEDQDGCDILVALRGLDGPVATAICACMTGEDAPEIQARCLAAGFDRFMSKPIDSSALERVLAEVRLKGGTSD